MAKQTNRGRLASLATRQLPSSALNAEPEGIGAQPENPGLSRTGLVAAELSAAIRDHADLAGANLTRADLRDATLRFAILTAAKLEAADLSRANLQLALFNQANLEDANLSAATLDHANLAGANLGNTKSCGASLRFAILEGAKFDSADLSSADLRHARLHRADFKSANLRDAQLDYTDFSGVNLAGADLSGAHLRYAKNLTKGQLEEATVSESTILPFYFEDIVCWPPGDRRRAAASRPIWIAAAVVGSLAASSLVWQFQDSRDGLPLPARAEAAAGSAASEVALLTVAIAAPDSRIQSVEPSGVIRVGPEFAPLRPDASAPALVAATSSDLPLAAEAQPISVRYAPADVLTPLAALDSVQSAEVAPYRLALSTPRLPALSQASAPLLKAAAAIQTVAVRELDVGELALDPGDASSKPAPFVFPGYEPLTLVVSLREQKLDVYRGTNFVVSSKVSSGKRGHETNAGVFSILEKRRRHHSNLYSNAPMPWMQRLTWSGTALHGGVVPGYPASHGCVRLPFSFAPKLFQMTAVGANVVVAGDRVVPKPIEHATLFQPARSGEEVVMAVADQDRLVSGELPQAAAAEQVVSTEAMAAFAASATNAPLRILVTRRTERDQVITIQYLLASLGYLTPQNFSGRLGKETAKAIRAFQKANSLPQTGALSSEFVKKIHEVAGKAEPPAGHLFVRQDYRPVLDIPIAFGEPEKSLGTHIFTLGLAQGSAKAEWTAISLEGDDSASALHRIEIPEHVRQSISERLTPGSSLIVADNSVNSAILPDGDDYLVLANVTPAIAALDSRRLGKQETAKPKRAKAANAAVKPRIQGTRKRAARRVYRGPDVYGGFGLFRRW